MTRKIPHHICALLSMGLLSLSACQDSLPIADTELAISTMKALSDDAMQGRRVDTEGAAMARRYLIETIRNINPDLVVKRVPFSQKVLRRDTEMIIEGETLVVTFPGDRPDGPILEIGAHYDHVGMIDGKVFNGADDNASGVGALMAIINALNDSPPDHQTNVIFFDGEEFGLAGAKAYARDLDARPRVMMNLDMISQNADSIIYAAGTYHTPELIPLINRAAEDLSLDVRLGHDRPEEGRDDWTFSSDHGPFHRRGIPFVYYGVEDHPHYHRSTDDFETIPLPVYRETVQLAVSTAILLDDALPTLAITPVDPATEVDP